MSLPMTITHPRSPACRKLLDDWWREPKGSVRYRLAEFAFRHDDFEVRDHLLTFLADDPADSEPVACARQLMPLLVLADPVHDPVDLRDELDAIARDMEMLRLRTVTLAAKYRALEPHSELWNRYPHDAPEFGALNITWTCQALKSVDCILSDFVPEQLAEAKEWAAKLRVYDNAEAVQA